MGLIKPTLPKTWKFSATGLRDVPQQVSVELIMRRIERLAEAPQGYRQVTYSLNVILPGNSEDALDDALIDVLNAIDDVPNLKWEGAERGDWGLEASNPTNPCYTLTLTFPFIKD